MHVCDSTNETSPLKQLCLFWIMSVDSMSSIPASKWKQTKQKLSNNCILISIQLKSAWMTSLFISCCVVILLYALHFRSIIMRWKNDAIDILTIEFSIRMWFFTSLIHIFKSGTGTDTCYFQLVFFLCKTASYPPVKFLQFIKNSQSTCFVWDKGNDGKFVMLIKHGTIFTRLITFHLTKCISIFHANGKCLLHNKLPFWHKHS